MELEDTFASAAAGAKAQEGDGTKKKFGVVAAVLALFVFVVFAASGPEEEAAQEADGPLLGATAGSVECSYPTAQAILQSCGGSQAWDVGAGTYAERRRAALAGEAADMVGSKIVLTELEQAADSLLRAARAVDLTDSPPLPSVHFFDAKARYDAGSVLPIVRAVSAASASAT
eukprot:COSAG02_NODE_2196_length_9548_cov_2.748227_6_plen_173_part_00